jgi:hypothetical protein
METWERLGPHTAPLDRRKLGIRSRAVERMRKRLRTSGNWGSLCHLDWFWRNYPWLLPGLQLRGLFLLEGTLPLLGTLLSLKGFCVWGKREYEITNL